MLTIKISVHSNTQVEHLSQNNTLNLVISYLLIQCSDHISVLSNNTITNCSTFLSPILPLEYKDASVLGSIFQHTVLQFRMVFGIPQYLIKLKSQYKICIVGTFDNNKVYTSVQYQQQTVQHTLVEVAQRVHYRKYSIREWSRG